MIEIAEGASVAWPMLVTIAAAVALDRRRECRRRTALNVALHELRRPLNALALATHGPAGRGRSPVGTRGQVEAAIAALAGLDAEVNGRRAPRLRARLRADELARDAIERWSAPAALLGRDLDLRWRAGPAVVVGDRAALSRALDNLLANALEHGGRAVRIEAGVARRRLRIAVAEGDRGAGNGRGELAVPLRRAPAGNRDPRRGHGLATVARIASAHGGRLAFRRDGAGARAVLELPLADGLAGDPELGVPASRA